MIYLILAIVSSMLVSVCMRLSEGRVKNNISMLAMNYVMCTALSAVFSGTMDFIPKADGLGFTLLMGIISPFSPLKANFGYQFPEILFD